MSDYNSSLPIRTETSGDAAVKVVDGTITSQALSVDSSGRIVTKIQDSSGNAINSTAGAVNIVGSVTQGTSPWVTHDNGLPTTVDTNYGTVGASTLRSAAQIGNATGASDFNNGASGAQTLRVAANLAVAGANVTATNPVPVVFEDAPGTHVNDYKAASAVAAAASDNHDYTVTAGKTLHLTQIEAAASGKAKMLVTVETGVASGVFTTYWAKFNSASDTNMSIILQNDILVAAGVRVRLVMTNKDNQSQDLYSTISGYEL